MRDAAARLPNGEGTRGDICELLKDSQFLCPGVTDTQVSVSRICHFLAALSASFMILCDGGVQRVSCGGLFELSSILPFSYVFGEEIISRLCCVKLVRESCFTER